MKLFSGADLIIYFFIYGILAWVLNTVIYSLKEQKYINTGVLNIPIIGCPAFIMILMIIVSSGKNVSYYGMLMMAFIDYFILDRMGLFFSQRLLLKKEINSLRDNYGKSLKLSCINAIIVVGICFVLFKTLHPIVFSFVSLIPGIIVNIIALVLAVLLIADIVTIYIFVRKYPMKNMDTNIASRKNTFGEWISKHIWYSYMPFNIDGRTNLLFMFFWGIVALVWFKFAYPPFSQKGINTAKLIWVLFISSLIGDIVETIYVLIVGHELMRRSSFVLGPFSLVWGLGAVILTLVLSKVKRQNNLSIFISGFLFGGVNI